MKSAPKGASLLKLLAAALVATAFACSDDTGTSPGPTVASLQVSAGSSTTLGALDATLELDATAEDGDGEVVNDAPIEWSSDASEVAAVDDDGLVTAISNGNATIMAESGSATASLAVTVEQEATEIVFTSAPHHNFVDESFEDLEVEVRDANGHVATNFSEQITISIGDNPRDASLTGQFGRAATDGVAAFPGLALDAAGADYTLTASTDELQAESAAFNVTRRSAYVGQSGGSEIVEIDLQDNSVRESVSVGSSPTGIALTPDGLFAYVSTRHVDSVAVVETPGNTVVERIAVGTNPNTLAMAPDGGTVYVGNSSDSTVSVIETETNTVTTTVDVGAFPVGLEVTPGGGQVYVSGYEDTEVTVLETATRAVATTIGVGDGPIDTAITPDGSTVYVPNRVSGNVSVIATSTNSVVATIPVGTQPSLGDLSPDGSAMFVPNEVDATVSRIETGSNTVSTTIPVGLGAVNATVSPDGQFVYVANYDAGTVSVIEVASNSVTETLSVSDSPFSVAFIPDPTP